MSPIVNMLNSTKMAYNRLPGKIGSLNVLTMYRKSHENSNEHVRSDLDSNIKVTTAIRHLKGSVDAYLSKLGIVDVLAMNME